MDQYLLGLDIGTSACKAALFGRDGTVIASATGAYPVAQPAPGWAEQKELLRTEGITFKENGCVDIKKHGRRP